MKPGWAAGVTRARLLLGRTIGTEQALSIASRPSLAEGVRVLEGSPYGERVQANLGLAAAERGVAETLLWHLRILAGWLPGAGAGLVRVLAGWFEIQNIDARLAALSGDGHEPAPFVLGPLATIWNRLQPSGTAAEIADVVAASAWGDPGGHSPAELAFGLRVAWARRVRDAAPAAAEWVAGAGALLAARELLLTSDRAHAERLRELPGIEPAALAAGALDDLRHALGTQAAWALAGTSDPSELWRAELAWWRRLESDARALLRARSADAVIVAVVSLLAADARRTVRALDAAACGGAPGLVELVGEAA